MLPLSFLPIDQGISVHRLEEVQCHSVRSNLKRSFSQPRSLISNGGLHRIGGVRGGRIRLASPSGRVWSFLDDARTGDDLRFRPKPADGVVSEMVFLLYFDGMANARGRDGGIREELAAG